MLVQTTYIGHYVVRQDNGRFYNFSKPMHLHGIGEVSLSEPLEILSLQLKIFTTLPSPGFIKIIFILLNSAIDYSDL